MQLNRKKRLLLINPLDNSHTYGEMRRFSHVHGRKGGVLSSTLPTVAALTPSEVEVQIVDERVQEIDFDASCDLVGITGMATQMGRGRAIAERFRQRGVKVVCGGPSPSVSPERWRASADVLIVGEAERIWPTFINDWLNDDDKPEYREEERFDLCITPVPDYSAMNINTMELYGVGCVQTSRGCPYNCEFCDAIVYAGRKTRYRPVETIVEEMEVVHGLGFRVSMLSDDNIIANRKKCKEILLGIADWNRRKREKMAIIATLSIDAARDDEFLEMAVEAGINRAFVGIETYNKESLSQSNKKHNLSLEVKDAVRKFHQHGIMIYAGCMVGFDHDDPSSFKSQFEFFQDLSIPQVWVFRLQAMDGTPLKRRLEEEGRYIDFEESFKDLERFNCLNGTTMRPKQMTTQQLNEGIVWLLENLYERKSVVQRFRGFLKDYKAKKTEVGPNKSMNRRRRANIVRFLRYLIFQGTFDQRLACVQLLREAARSQHPLRWQMALGSLLFMCNVHYIIEDLKRDLDMI